MPSRIVVPTTAESPASAPSPRLAVSTPARRGLVAVGNWFGECSFAPCIQELRFRDGDVRLLGRDPGPGRHRTYIDNGGTLTSLGLRRATELTEGIAVLPRTATYGCPDCTDGGASWVTFRTAVRHHLVYDFGAPPMSLERLDTFVQQIRAALTTCRRSAEIVPAPDCRPYRG